MAPTSKNSRKSLSTKCQLPGSMTIDKENAFLHSVSEFHSRIRRRESIRLKYKVRTPTYIVIKASIICVGKENRKIYENLFVINGQKPFVKKKFLYIFICQISIIIKYL